MTPRNLACVPRWMAVHPRDEAEWRFAKQEDEFGLGPVESEISVVYLGIMPSRKLDLGLR